MKAADRTAPTPASTLLFHVKTIAFRLQRLARDLGDGPRRMTRDDPAAFPVVLTESRTALWSDVRPEERALQLGKVENLRRACAALDRVRISANQTFGFWAHVGAPTRGRGFVAGRMLQEGCLVASVGGGLCQLSNALFDAAFRAGCEIVERHPHSRIVPGSAAEAGRDATVAWNYVDLRFRSGGERLLRAKLTRDELIVQVRARQAVERGIILARAFSSAPTPIAANTCATCNRTDCHRHEPGAASRAPSERTSFLLDETWPELTGFVAGERSAQDQVLAPRPARLPSSVRTGEVRGAPLTALARSLDLRLNAASGARTRAAELRGADGLARAFGHRLGPESTRIVVAQTLAVELWRRGRLGGRDTTVLMTRTPIAVLQTRLDQALARHPERRSLGDFRADPDLARAEAEVLAYAYRIITPHADLAKLYPEKTTLIPWRIPVAQSSPAFIPASRRIAFPGPTIARKGAFEVRSAARALDLEVALLGAELEGDGFWDGVRAVRPPPGTDWLDGVAVVVLPALVEHAPRRLLQALASGKPVVATAECGIAPQAGLTLVPAGDADALAAAIASHIAGAP